MNDENAVPASPDGPRSEGLEPPRQHTAPAEAGECSSPRPEGDGTYRSSSTGATGLIGRWLRRWGQRRSRATAPAPATAPTPTPTKPKKSRLRRLLRWSLVGLATLALAWLLWLWYEAHDLERARRVLAASGMPTDADALLPAVAEDRNAVPLYERAFIRMSERRPGDVYRPGTGGNPDDRFQELRLFLADHPGDLALPDGFAGLLGEGDTAAILDLLRAGGRRPAAGWRHDRSKGAMMVLPEISFGMQANALLLLAGRHAEVAGDLAGAGAVRMDALRLAAHFNRSADTLIGLLVGIAMEWQAQDEIVAALRRGCPLDAVELAAAWPDDLKDDLRRTLHCERLLFGDWVFGGVERGDPEVLLDGQVMVPPLYASFLCLPLRLRDRRVYLDYWTGLEAWYVRSQEGASAWLPLAGLPRGPFLRGSSPFLAPLSAMLLPSIETIFPRVADAETRRRLLTTALAVEDHRRLSGTFPAKLADLDTLPSAVSAHDATPFTYDTTADGGRRLAAILADEGQDGPRTFEITIPAGRSPAP